MPMENSMPIAVVRHIRIFRDGRDQTIRIPREFEHPGNEAIVRKEGECLIIEPVKASRLCD